MKKAVLISLLLLLVGIAQAQVSKTINVSTAGTLSSLLTVNEKTTVTNLTITGNIDARDFKTLRDNMPVLAILNMSAVSIKAYQGIGGSNYTYAIGAFYNYETSTTYLANEIPKYSFYDATEYYYSQDPYNRNGNYLVSKISLKSITLPISITSIADFAFYGCSGLKTIYSLNSTPPTIGISAFTNVAPSFVYVSALSVSAYKTATGWNPFYSVIFGYNMTVQTSTGGSVNENNVAINDGSIIGVVPNTTKTFSFTPIAGYQVSALTYNGIDVKSQIVNNQFTTPAINANATLNVTFSKVQYRLSIKSAESGVSYLNYEFGATPSVGFEAASGWVVHTVLYNGNDITNQLVSGMFTVPAITENVLINVSFELVTPLLTPANNRIKVYSTQSTIVVEGTSVGETISLITVGGVQLKSIKSSGERIIIIISAPQGTTYLVKTATKTVKVAL